MNETQHLDPDQLTEVNDASDQPVDAVDAPLVAEAERFDQIGLLGKGGMGEVRLYRDRRISRFVARKVLHTRLQNDSHYRSRFLLEARVQGQLEHPAIVPVHELAETADGELYFEMKCVKGVTLRQALEAIRAGDITKYSRRRLLTAFSSVCLAVDFAHTRGVVHRDLKPENVMLGAFGEVYVLDWGIAKVMHLSETPLEPVDVPAPTTATRVGATLGTPRYMAPERHLGVANPSTDVFALGTILAEILAAHGEGDLPPELEEIQLRATALNASDRYASARELHDALERYLDGDRDLAMRKQLAEEHARRAEQALARAEHEPAARSQAGQEIGRALGLDPDNRFALRTLMRLLTDVPSQLPAAARAEMELRWRDRQVRTQRLATMATLSMLGLVPMILWMGVRDWPLLGVYIALVAGAGAVQFFAVKHKYSIIVALLMLLTATSLLTRSLGLAGAAPAALAVIAIAWRMNVHKTIHGLMILGVTGVFLIAPFVLVELGMISANYVARDGGLLLLPKMHELPPAATLASLVMGTFGAVGVALIYGRLYMNELRRAEHRLSFQAWQLQQLVPPER
ncbi:MAG TPA: protein kinase [Kofleriaceae bacterium]